MSLWPFIHSLYSGLFDTHSSSLVLTVCPGAQPVIRSIFTGIFYGEAGRDIKSLFFVFEVFPDIKRLLVNRPCITEDRCD